MPETKRMAEEANRMGQEAQEQAKRVGQEFQRADIACRPALPKATALHLATVRTAMLPELLVLPAMLVPATHFLHELVMFRRILHKRFILLFR